MEKINIARMKTTQVIAVSIAEQLTEGELATGNFGKFINDINFIASFSAGVSTLSTLKSALEDFNRQLICKTHENL